MAWLRTKLNIIKKPWPVQVYSELNLICARARAVAGNIKNQLNKNTSIMTPRSSARQSQSRLQFQSTKGVEAPADYLDKKAGLLSGATVDEDQQAKLLSQHLRKLNSDPRYEQLLQKLVGGQMTVHQEELTTVDKLLRQFDLNSSYGPCAGISRLDRWRRAEKLGKNPPEEVLDILNSPVGNFDQYKYSFLGVYP